MQYDEELFQEFRAKAITNIAELEVGETYYSNSHPREFKVLGLLTEQQLHKKKKWKNRKADDNTVLKWIVTGRGAYDHYSLRDRNIGASYNPWLVFKEEADALDCRQRLKISWPVPDKDYAYW